MATQTYMGIPNDPRINEDEPTKAMLNGATQAAYEAGIPSPTLTQRASDIAMAEETNAINHEITSRYANAAIMAPIIQNAMTQPQPQPQQPQIEQQAPVLTQGLLPSLMKNNAYQGREMSGTGMAPQEPQTLTQMARKYGQDILDAKQLYAQGEAMGGDQGAQVMALAHSGAERARAGLLQLGVNPNDYGLNGTYDEAAQGLASNDTRAMQNILQGEMAESSGQYYDRIYKILRDQGFSRDIAESEAHRRAQSYASQRVQALNQAFNTYGHNGQVINPMGIQMLGMMAQEDTDMANYYTQRYAGPLQEYAKANQRENAAIQHGYKKEDMAIGHQYDLDKMAQAQKDRVQMAGIQAEIQEAHANNDVVRAVQKAGALYALQAKYGIGKGTKTANGISSAQAKQAAEMIKQIDTKLKDGLGLSDAEKAQLNAERAKYQSVVDAYIGFGQQSGGSGGKDYNLNDYNDAMAFAKEKIQENADKGYPYDRAQLRNMLRPYIGDWADDVEFGYGDEEESNIASTSAPARPSAPQVVYLPATESGDNPGGYADDYGTRGNIPIVGFLKNFGSNIAQSMRDNPTQTEAGRMALRRYGKE